MAAEGIQCAGLAVDCICNQFDGSCFAAEFFDHLILDGKQFLTCLTGILIGRGAVADGFVQGFDFCFVSREIGLGGRELSGQIPCGFLETV